MVAKNAEPLAEEIGMLIARSRRLIWQEAGRKLDSAGESLLAWQTLTRLMNDGPTTQRALADAMGQHPAGVCRLLEDLEERGFVQRVRNPDDRRCMQVRLTTKGRARHKHFRPHIIEAMQTALQPLSASERKVLRDLLERVADAAAGQSTATAAHVARHAG
jgi:DNA-binding MarR family transcriptional regulator